jgi:hypothetical protein
MFSCGIPPTPVPFPPSSLRTGGGRRPAGAHVASLRPFPFMLTANRVGSGAYPTRVSNASQCSGESKAVDRSLSVPMPAGGRAHYQSIRPRQCLHRRTCPCVAGSILPRFGRDVS